MRWTGSVELALALPFVIEGAAAAQRPAQDERAEAASQGAPASVELRNEVGTMFRLVEARVLLDDREVAHVVAPEDRELPRVIRAYDGKVGPGAHRMTAVLVFEGRNRGPFSYVDNYRFRAEAQYLFTTPDPGEGPAAVQVVATELKGANRPMAERLSLRFAPAPGSGLPPPEPLPALSPVTPTAP